jgi:hypothetical protein
MSGHLTRQIGQLNQQLQQGFHVSVSQVFEGGMAGLQTEKKKSLSYFVGQKMADTYQNMRILTSGREFKDQRERVYVPVIKIKYQNMRNTLETT